MSRLGRDYLKVGQVMEILRQKGIRLIAINDGVDSDKGDDDFIPFRNIMNEYYARDTSRKIRSVFKSKGMSGKHMTGQVPYGYLWADEKRQAWVIDEDAVEVVRRYPDGWGDAHPLTGLMYCADCGGKMYVHRINNGKRIAHYTCGEYGKVPVGVRCSTQHRIKADSVFTLISDMLKAIAEYSKNDRTEFIKAVQDAQTTQQTAGINKRKKAFSCCSKTSRRA